jgi:N-carbamoylputrescine amidase
MKVTVCELPNTPDELDSAWQQLVEHVASRESDLVLLPEMPFFRWLAHTNDFRADLWDEAVRAHDDWIRKLEDLTPATVVSTRPAADQGKRHNVGYTWEPVKGAIDAHTKFYLPDEPGFWEATWYERGHGNFNVVDTIHCKIGFLICTELWFNSHARDYGKQGMDVLVCPRATPRSTVEKWVFGGQAAAVVSGAFCLSSNLSGTTPEGCDFAGTGWIISPDGDVLGFTSTEHPFVTLDLDLDRAREAKKTHPRYVED